MISLSSQSYNSSAKGVWAQGHWEVLTGHSFTKDTSLGILILISRNGIRFFFQKTTGGMTKLASDNMSTLGATVDSLVGIDL